MQLKQNEEFSQGREKTDFIINKKKEEFYLENIFIMIIHKRINEIKYILI